MVEQWPFKPLVQGSSPCTLTLYLKSWFMVPRKGARTVEPLHAHFVFKYDWFRVPRKGARAVEPLHAHFVFKQHWFRVIRKGARAIELSYERFMTIINESYVFTLHTSPVRLRACQPEEAP